PHPSNLIMRVGARMLDKLLIVARELHRPELEGELAELASEAERHLVVLVVDGRAGVDAHIEGLVDGDEEWNGVRDLTGGDLLIVHLQHARAALPEAWTIVFEVEHDGVLARGQHLLAFPAEAFQVEEVVEEHRLALEQVQAIAAEAPPIRDQYSLRAA